jgi:hypothetical protein
MRTVLLWAAAAAFLALPTGVGAQQGGAQPDSQGQTQTSGPSSTTPSPAAQGDSLAEAARRAREAKKDQPKPAKVFDNDNLPGGGISTVGKAEAPKDQATDATADKDKASGDGEKFWRGKFAELRAKLARDKEDLDVMQRELGQLDLQDYHNDPNKGMQQELTRGDINKKTADIDAKRKQIDADQQAIDDAEDDLRKSGGDSGWAR